MRTLGDAIRDAMAIKGVTQEQTSREVGVDRTTLSKYMNNHVDVPADIKRRLVKYLSDPVLRIKFYGTTSTNIVFDQAHLEFYKSGIKAIEEFEEIIESIKKVQKFFHNAESIEDLNDKQVEKIEKMMEEVGDGFFACITIDGICSDMGADLKKRNLRCLIKYHERGYLSDSIFKEALKRNGLSQNFIDKYEDAKHLREAL